MPEICRFYGIVIKMYFDDHSPPHFHAHYSGHEVRINIYTLAVVFGRLPAQALGLVAEWPSLHQEELLQLWQKAKNLQSLHKIEPLP